VIPAINLSIKQNGIYKPSPKKWGGESGNVIVNLTISFNYK